MRFGSQTDIGVKREMNQDYFYASTEPVGNLKSLFLVADGMGGHNAGEFASRYTVEKIVESVSKSEMKNTISILNEGISVANASLKEYADSHLEMKGMGTTIVAATVEDRHLVAANVGDSRLYLIGDEICQVTKDHSLVQEMVRLGEMDKERAKNHPDKNIITRAVGVDRKVVPDIFEEELKPGQYVLLCSDGLTNMVEDEKILQILREEGTPETKAQSLVEAANAGGGNDNITVIVIDPELKF